jgi:hypothetical protein
VLAGAAIPFCLVRNWYTGSSSGTLVRPWPRRRAPAHHLCITPRRAVRSRAAPVVLPQLLRGAGVRQAAARVPGLPGAEELPRTSRPGLSASSWTCREDRWRRTRCSAGDQRRRPAGLRRHHHRRRRDRGPSALQRPGTRRGRPGAVQWALGVGNPVRYARLQPGQVRGEMEDIPLPDASVDVVISNGVLSRRWPRPERLGGVSVEGDGGAGLRRQTPAGRTIGVPHRVRRRPGPPRTARRWACRTSR